MDRWIREDGGTVVELVARAIKEYDRVRFFRKANAGYKALRADPVAWAQEVEERRLWDNTLMDGLEDDPYPIDDEDREPTHA